MNQEQTVNGQAANTLTPNSPAEPIVTANGNSIASAPVSQADIANATAEAVTKANYTSATDGKDNETNPSTEQLQARVTDLQDNQLFLFSVIETLLEENQRGSELHRNFLAYKQAAITGPEALANG